MRITFVFFFEISVRCVVRWRLNRKMSKELRGKKAFNNECERERVREMVICLYIFSLFIEELKYEQGLSGKDE